MKCEKCNGKRYYMALGWQRKTCPECHGTGEVLKLKRQTNDDMERVVTTQVVVKKKRGRPKKDRANDLI